jgi:hypothetical protein
MRTERTLTSAEVTLEDLLAPDEYLLMELLVARYDLGHASWTFPPRLNPTLNRLDRQGLTQWRALPDRKGWTKAWLTPQGCQLWGVWDD